MQAVPSLIRIDHAAAFELQCWCVARDRVALMTEKKTNPRATTPEPSFSPSAIERRLQAADGIERPAHLPAAGSVIGGKYRIDRLIAHGGMGVVYAASHQVSGKKVALKWMLPALVQIKGARERFIREACAAARITHPNIVDIYDVGAEFGSVYLVMEYLYGETLSARLARGIMPLSDVIAVLIHAMRGVAAAHARGVVHRDLKPDNIMLCYTADGEEREPKVLDFGISKIADEDAEDLNLTYNGAMVGTPYYMSPEQVHGPRWVDVRTDVYALGVILFEALAGERPFNASTYEELVVKIATAPPPQLIDRIPGIDPTLSAIVEHAMARDPNDRFPTVEALASALERFSDGVRFRTLRASHSMVGPLLASAPLYPLPTPKPLDARAPAPRLALPPVQTLSRSTTLAIIALSVVCGAQGVYLIRREAPVLLPSAPVPSAETAPASLHRGPSLSISELPLGTDDAAQDVDSRNQDPDRGQRPTRMESRATTKSNSQTALRRVRETRPAPGATPAPDTVRRPDAGMNSGLAQSRDKRKQEAEQDDYSCWSENGKIKCGRKEPNTADRGDKLSAESTPALANPAGPISADDL